MLQVYSRYGHQAVTVIKDKKQPTTAIFGSNRRPNEQFAADDAMRRAQPRNTTHYRVELD